MNFSVFTRRELVKPPVAACDLIVVLEGAITPEVYSPGVLSSSCQSLDESIDARHQWIDEVAASWAQRLAEAPVENNATPIMPTAAWLNVLSLRYYLVKLIRVVTFFTEIQPLSRGDTIRLVAESERDSDYAHLLNQLCRLASATCQLDWKSSRPKPEPTFPSNGRWRRTVSRITQTFREPRTHSTANDRVVLCGNANLLGPVCRELLMRNARVWWLFDRFAMKAFLRWFPAGCGQLVCNADRGRVNQIAIGKLPQVVCRGVNLSGPIAQWLKHRVRTHGCRQTTLIHRIDEHFHRIRPHSVLIDEDATPMARGVVAMASRHKAISSVVQHGAPCCRFGYTPIAADRIFAWGLSSRQQLTDWGTPPQKILATGSPRHDAMIRANIPNSRDNPTPRLLLITTVPPRDDRPDAVMLHLTQTSYAAMLRAALGAIARLPQAELTIKLHPRAPEDPILSQILEAFPIRSVRLARRGSAEKYLARCDCVLSCLSSAGVESTLAAVPVIQLLPPNAGDILPSDQWGALGTASDEESVYRLLQSALNDRPRSNGPDPHLFANLEYPAATRIAEIICSGNLSHGTR